MNKSSNNNNFIPAVERAVALIECLGSRDGGMSQAELSSELEITQSSCYRIIQTLIDKGWLKKVGGNRFDLAAGLLTATAKLVDAGKRFEILQPLLDQLSAMSGLSSKLSIRSGDEQETILRSESPRPMAINGKTGARFPLIEGSVGAALLADCSEKEIKNLCKNCKEEICEREDIGIILRRIQEVKKRGYCFSNRFTRWNGEAMSAPIRDTEGNIVAALTLLGFNDDFEADKIEYLKGALLRSAELSREKLR